MTVIPKSTDSLQPISPQLPLGPVDKVGAGLFNILKIPPLFFGLCLSGVIVNLKSAPKSLKILAAVLEAAALIAKVVSYILRPKAPPAELGAPPGAASGVVICDRPSSEWY